MIGDGRRLWRGRPRAATSLCAECDQCGVWPDPDRRHGDHAVAGRGQIIGTVGVDAANPSLTGKVAFAIALDPLTGQVYVAQYLSLHQDSATNTPNDLLSLAAGSVGVTVTLTDGDGDQVTSAADIGTHINFLDDGPSNITPGAVSLLNGSGTATASLDSRYQYRQ